MQNRVLVCLVAAVGLVVGACQFARPADVPGDAYDGDGPDADGRLTLTIVAGGAGTGTVVSDPIGIDCGATCGALFDGGTQVTLSATPAAGNRFSGWGGACSGSEPTCALILVSNTQVTANFAVDTQPVTVVITGNGSGTVASVPAGRIACPGDCIEAVPVGDSLTVAATASVDSSFLGWSGGGCTGLPDCTVAPTQATTVTAAFGRQNGLVVVLQGNGHGTVTGTGIDCGADCDETYAPAQMVTITATPDADSVFTGWANACSGTGPCTLTMDAAKLATATFTLRRYTLTVARNGNGMGTVTSSPSGIVCGSTCSAMFDHGTVVTLGAVPVAGSGLQTWSGACSGDGACSITMTGNATVTATFDAVPPNIVFAAPVANGNLGGLAGADAICAARASALGLTGTYRAWLSTSTVNAIDRLGAASGWVTDVSSGGPPDYRPFASSQADLVAGKIFYSINASTFTGTLATGTHAATDCLGWTSAAAGETGTGGIAGGTLLWTDVGSTACSQSRKILCFGIDRTSTVGPAPIPGARMSFLTASMWTPGGGVSTADAVCAVEASAAGYSGTFVADLAPDRFEASSEPPWVRPDDVDLAYSGNQVTTQMSYVSSAVWYGESANCNAWTSNSASMTGDTLQASSTKRHSGPATACSTALRLRCRQQ